MTKCHENLGGHNPSPWHVIMDHVKWHVKTLDHVAGWHKLPGASNSHDLLCSQLVLLYLFRFSFYLQGDHLWSGSKPWWVIMNLLACLFSKICFIIHLLFTLLWMAWEKKSWRNLMVFHLQYRYHVLQSDCNSDSDVDSNSPENQSILIQILIGTNY